MDIYTIREKLKEIALEAKNENDLYNLYEAFKDEENRLLDILRELFIARKITSDSICLALFLHNEKYLAEDFTLLKMFCELEKEQELPRLHINVDNKKVLLDILFDALNVNIDAKNNSWIDIQEKAQQYYEYILDFCSYIKDDCVYKNILEKIETHKNEVSADIVNKIKYHRDYDSVGYFPEDYIDWCDLALSFNPHNQEALRIKKGFLD